MVENEQVTGALGSRDRALREAQHPVPATPSYYEREDSAGQRDGRGGKRLNGSGTMYAEWMKNSERERGHEAGRGDRGDEGSVLDGFAGRDEGGGGGLALGEGKGF